MVDFKNEQLYRQDSIDKQLKIEFDSGTITNSDIPSEQFELTESLTSESQLVFGSCEASEIKFRIYNVFLPLKDKLLTVTQTLNGDTSSTLQIGKYKVYSDKPTADRGYRDVVAYDSMYDIINTDVASWYNGLTFPMSLKAFRDSFFAFFGIEQENVSLVNDSMEIERTIDVQVLSGRDVIQSICQINGCFGHIARNGKFKYVFLETISGGLYPSNDIYPANDLYPQQPNVQIVGSGLYVDTPTYEDFTVKPIDKLQIREKEGDIGVIVGNGDNTYIVEDNFLVYGKSTEDLTVIAENMLSVIEGLEYRPFDATLVGNPCIEVGDMVRLHTKYQIIDSYVLQRTLSGVQALRDEFSADGEEYQSEKVNDIQTEIKQLKGKSNTLERTLEETKSTIADVGKGLQSKITQTAESIALEVKRATKKEGELSSQIEVTAESISSEVSRAKESEADLSSRIEQTVSSISLTVNNGDTTAGIVITLENEDGTTSQVTGTIDMTGLVSFTDLAGQGTTTINGSNITTGTINCDLLNGGAINGQKIVGGSIDGTYIDGSNISANRLSSVGTSYLDSIQIGGNERISYTSILTVIYGVINPGLNDCLNISSELQVQQGINCLGDFLLPIAYNNTTTNKINVNISSSGRFRRNTESSKKYKHDITTHLKSKLNPKNLLNANIYQYKYNNDYLSSEDLRYNTDVIGFIVEDLEKHYPIAIDYNEDDNGNLIPQDWNERFIIPPMLKLIQEQQKEIETLKSEMEEMKSTISFLMERIGANNE